MSKCYDSRDVRRAIALSEARSVAGRIARSRTIALEVIITHGAIDKLDVYLGLGVREVWTFEAGRFRVLVLRGDHYEAIDASEALPEVDLVRIAHHALQKDQHAALRAFRDELRNPP
jgi:hypothetical protein